MRIDFDPARIRCSRDGRAVYEIQGNGEWRRLPGDEAEWCKEQILKAEEERKRDEHRAAMELGRLRAPSTTMPSPSSTPPESGGSTPDSTPPSSSPRAEESPGPAPASELPGSLS